MKERPATWGDSQSSWPTSLVFFLLVVTTLITPAGMPAWSASSARARAERGVSSAGFTTQLQPAARAAPTFRQCCPLDVEEGAINRTFPCMDANYPYAIKNQRGASKIPSIGSLWMPKLVLYGIRLLGSSWPVRAQ